MERYPVRAGVFSSAPAALELVKQLREAGFTWDEISVICSDQAREDLFPEPTQKAPSGSHTGEALNIAGASLLGIGGAAAIAALFTTAGTAVMIFGAFAGLAAGGTFASLMMTRGFETEAADYYDQAVEEGKILVAVEVDGEDQTARERRELAGRLIEAAGSEPLPLAH